MIKRTVLIQPDEDESNTTIIELDEEQFDKLADDLCGLDLGHRTTDEDDVLEYKQTRMVLSLPYVEGTQHIFNHFLIETELLTVFQAGYDYSRIRSFSDG